MNREAIEMILAEQRAYFATGETLQVDFRIVMLKKLYTAIQSREEEITRALAEDLGKSDFEGFMCEIGMVLSELSYLIRHTKRFAKTEKVSMPMAQFPSKGLRKPSPYGNVLIMSPWNYPFLLTLDPLVDALAAGNTAVVKPSAYSPATSRVVEELLADCFSRKYVAVVTGGREENTALLEQKFDFIFFTGSQNVGKEVLRRAAEHLTPAVLELGGKSPCIVDSSAKIELAARRIVFGKYLNCGQTCVAPDYILCDATVKKKLEECLKAEIVRQFGGEPLQNPDYGRIVNEKHFDRLLGLMDREKLAIGGEYDRQTLRIAPTLMTDVTEEDGVMQEEIFGPILPILTFDRFEDIFSLLQRKEKPLALYLFSEDKTHIRQVTERLSFGGGCINDVIIHLATEKLGFGGVGESGMGAYHGKVGFDTFSHHKSMVDKSTRVDLPMRYQPYQRKKYNKTMHRCLK